MTTIYSYCKKPPYQIIDYKIFDLELTKPVRLSSIGGSIQLIFFNNPNALHFMNVLALFFYYSLVEKNH